MRRFKKQKWFKIREIILKLLIFFEAPDTIVVMDPDKLEVVDLIPNQDK